MSERLIMHSKLKGGPAADMGRFFTESLEAGQTCLGTWTRPTKNMLHRATGSDNVEAASRIGRTAGKAYLERIWPGFKRRACTGMRHLARPSKEGAATIAISLCLGRLGFHNLKTFLLRQNFAAEGKMDACVRLT